MKIAAGIVTGCLKAAQLKGRRVRWGVARVRVTDTGPGIPPQVRGRLFEPFVTAAVGAGEGEDEQGGKGTGLGLFICRDLAQNAGGRIGVDSDRGSGAAIWVVLSVPGVFKGMRVKRQKEAGPGLTGRG